ncbi:UNVERIFIED_CONTAM: hypothetical protein Sangu_2361900 [Sesamum angustifolium]|uniref:Pectinesterase inhibitor domain-containing protein n=1 Tax=Sesamum angustifolium TaxID=2727405 RepID=A0AAW2KXA9_9LAMI
MGFTKTTASFTLAILATFFLMSAANPFCDTAKDKVLCMQMTKDAKTWDVAMTNALNAALEKAKCGKKIVDNIALKLPGNLKPQTKDSIAETCHEAYENIIDSINKSIGVVKNDPTLALNNYLSAAAFSDCTDSLNEFEISLVEATNFDGEILKLTSTLLAIAGKKP